MKTQNFSKRILFLLFASWMCIGTLFSASRQMEYLDRGVVAVKVNNGVFISWRYLGTDDPSIGFNIYRDGTKVNASPITTKTNYVDGQGGTTALSFKISCSCSFYPYFIGQSNYVNKNSSKWCKYLNFN